MKKKELITKIESLKAIEPDPQWIEETKKEILGEKKVSFFGFSRLVFASLLILIILGGTFGFAQNSLPGEWLFPLKKMQEKGQEVFVPIEERPKFKLERANKRLEELKKIVESNKVRKLAPAIEEFESSVSEATKELVKTKKIDEEIVQEAKKLEEKKERVEEALGVVTGTEEFDKALAQMVKREIEDLENRSLTERQEEILEKAKEDFKKGNYSGVLEKILILSHL